MSHLVTIPQTIELSSAQLAQVTIRAMNDILGEYRVIDGVLHERVEYRRTYRWEERDKSILTAAQWHHIKSASLVIANIENALGVEV
jgi:hypothetical protein